MGHAIMLKEPRPFALIRGAGGPVSRRWTGRAIAAAALSLGALAAPAPANDNPVFLQWFEQRWTDMEHRVPDFFLAGYGATWLPPVSRAQAANSVGYDVFDRFNLGSPASPTAYGTEEGFRAVVQEFHQANTLVYIDSVMNHNSPRQTGADFQALGGYPGFWMAPQDPPRNKLPTDNWGDFQQGTPQGFYQSTDPNAPLYDLFRGDLLGLIDIDQGSDHQFIRHPVDPDDPLNIPGGSAFNLPNPENRRFYPDRDLAGFTFWNPGTPRNPGGQQFTIYPYNTEDPMQGDPVPENATGLLMRWTQWMLDEFKVDGFRLDAAKHIPSWFWDRYWDSAVYLRRTTPWGSRVTPLSFVESVERNQWTYDNYVRKDGFANRDALDLNGAGALRNILNASGFGSWADVLSAHIDVVDDGLNNGSLGINHVFSHDNGSIGDGGSQPPPPSMRQQALPQHAYILMRSGRPLIYYNARGVARSGGFWPREGTPIALGFNPSTGQPDETMTRLVEIHTGYGRGLFVPLNQTDPGNSSMDDVLVFERRSPIGGGTMLANVLVGVNDRYDSGVQQRNVQTSFPSGTRLHELTGNAADPAVDPTGLIPEVLVVDPDGRVTIRVPNNRSVTGTEHNRGYVIYGPAVPSGTLEVTNVSAVIEPDPPQVPVHRRRLNPIPVISEDEFEIRLTTTQTDPLDPHTDDNAVFRINQGFEDFNGNGQVDIGPGHPVVPGYEQFLTLNEPLFGTTNPEGRYHQVIDSTMLPEGYNYISVVAFRARPSGGAPLFYEFRKVIYIDRRGPAIELVLPDEPPTHSSVQIPVRALDRTANRVHLLANVPDGVDPVSLVSPLNLAVRHDRFRWRRTLSGLNHGFNRITAVAFEISGNHSVVEEELFVAVCPADWNRDGVIDSTDLFLFLSDWAGGDADYNGDGVTDSTDLFTFLTDWAGGC